MIRVLGKLLMFLGLAGFCAATAWWYLFFHQMLGANVKQASACFYQTTGMCHVADMSAFAFTVPAYRPVLLWLSATLFIVGLVVWAMAPHRGGG